MPEETIQIDKQLLVEMHDTFQKLKKAALDYEATYEMRIPADLRVRIEDCVILDTSLAKLLQNE